MAKTTVKATKVKPKAEVVKAFWATGRRKSAIARVRLLPGDGSFVINNRDLNRYFGTEPLQRTPKEPLRVTGTEGKYNILANIIGGGTRSQSEALRHGIARALITMNPDLRKPLKQAGFLTRDAREKERRKVGRRKARKSPQYSKR